MAGSKRSVNFNTEVRLKTVSLTLMGHENKPLRITQFSPDDYDGASLQTTDRLQQALIEKRRALVSWRGVILHQDDASVFQTETKDPCCGTYATLFTFSLRYCAVGFSRTVNHGNASFPVKMLRIKKMRYGGLKNTLLRIQLPRVRNVQWL